jgi:type I restriction enzyme, S subunit
VSKAKLPAGWTNVRVDSLITAPVVYGILQPGPNVAGGIPYVRPTEIDHDIIQTNNLRLTSPDIAARYARSRIVADDVILSIVGTIGKVAIVPSEIAGGNITQSSARIRVNQEITIPRYVAWALRSPILRYQYDKSRLGTAVPRLNIAHVRELEIPVAPVKEQRRMVEKIEELFSKLDAGVAALSRVKTGLKRYRAAVLKAAVEGKLTVDWRAKHPDAEPASQLLERILRERRRKWEDEQRAKFAAAGKEPPKGWQAKYVEPAAPDTTDSPELPDGWTIASVDQLTSAITSGSRDWTQYYGSGTGTFIMAQNVRKGLLDLEYRQAVNPPPNDRDSIRSQVACNDLLVTIVGANTGDVCRVPSEIPEHYVCQSVALMRPVVADIAKYLEAYFVADHGGQKHFRRYIYGQGRPHLGFDELRMTPVLLPPLPEQEQVTSEVEERLTVIASAEQQIEANLKRAARLRQSILKRAFEGKLLPPDPTDEPADKLLERIRQERTATNASGAPRTRRSRKANLAES